MGYRSEVAIKCQKGAYEKISRAEGVLMYDKLLTDGDEYIMVWDWVKWYEDYPEIKGIEDVLDELDEIEDASKKGMAYKMIRLGEDDKDVEARDNSWDIEFYYIRKFDTEGFETVKEDTK